MLMKTVNIVCLAFMLLCGSTVNADAKDSKSKVRDAAKHSEGKVRDGTRYSRNNVVKRQEVAQKQKVNRVVASRTNVTQNVFYDILNRTETAIGFSEFLDTYGEIHAVYNKAIIIKDLSNVSSEEHVNGKKRWIISDLQNICTNGRRIKSRYWDANVLGSIKSFAEDANIKDIEKFTSGNYKKADECVKQIVDNYKKASSDLYKQISSEDRSTAKKGSKNSVFFDPNSDDGKRKVDSWASAHLRTVLNGK